MLTCATCGYEAADSFRFCPECGARADGRAREQRKVVTVLFCDVAGSTALGESLDAEALRAPARALYERMKSIVERHGGVVEKFIGDAVMAVFGLPAVHEDDAVRPLQAAAESNWPCPSSASRGGSASAAARWSRARSGSRRVTLSTVVDLVAIGRTNDEVAHELGLRPKTVEWTLTKVYRKLRVRSRTELALKVAGVKPGDSPGRTAQG